MTPCFLYNTEPPKGDPRAMPRRRPKKPWRRRLKWKISLFRWQRWHLQHSRTGRLYRLVVWDRMQTNAQSLFLSTR